jgi:hypothetical protein
MTPAPVQLLYCFAIPILVISGGARWTKISRRELPHLAEWHWFDTDCARFDGMVDLYGDIDAALGQSDKILRRKLDVDDAVVLRPSSPTVGIGA